MGLIVKIYRADYRSDMNRFDACKGLCIVNVEGPFSPDRKYPAARLVKHCGDWIVQPVEEPGEGHTPYMDGGSYAATSDSRWTRKVGYGAVPVHDSSATWAEYEQLSR